MHFLVPHTETSGRVSLSQLLSAEGRRRKKKKKQKQQPTLDVKSNWPPSPSSPPPPSHGRAPARHAMLL